MPCPFEDHRREPRQKVLLRARMRAGPVPVDVCIRDVSVRGLSLQAGVPPPRGSIVEIVYGGQSIVGQVRWSKDHRLGIAASEPIDVRRLLSGGTDLVPRDRHGIPRRRKSDWESKPRRIECRHQRARESSRTAEFAMFALFGMALSLWLSSFLYETLSPSFRRVGAGLRGERAAAQGEVIEARSQAAAF